jgi:hypothetical protein
MTIGRLQYTFTTYRGVTLFNRTMLVVRHQQHKPLAHQGPLQIIDNNLMCNIYPELPG